MAVLVVAIQDEKSEKAFASTSNSRTLVQSRPPDHLDNQGLKARRCEKVQEIIKGVPRIFARGTTLPIGTVEEC